jgi:hypothetical protein
MAIQLPNYQITQLPDSSAPPRLRGEIPQYYTALLARYGPQNWWPARSRFEVIVGAYLTQNTNWSNVEKAMANLRRARRLSVSAMRQIPLDELETLVRPSGYFRQKARNLKTFVAFLDRQYSGSHRAAGTQRRRPGNCRFHPALCRQSSRLRRGRLHAPRAAAPRHHRPENRVRRNSRHD